MGKTRKKSTKKVPNEHNKEIITRMEKEVYRAYRFIHRWIQYGYSIDTEPQEKEKEKEKEKQKEKEKEYILSGKPDDVSRSKHNVALLCNVTVTPCNATEIERDIDKDLEEKEYLLSGKHDHGCVFATDMFFSAVHSKLKRTLRMKRARHKPWFLQSIKYLEE